MGATGESPAGEINEIHRRQFHGIAAGSIAALCLLTWQRAHALSLADLTSSDASLGVKTALERGAQAAIESLGRPDGFLNNPKVRIPLPGFLEDAAQLLRKLGQAKRIDELEVSLNRAAEAAVPMSRDLLVGAVRNMSVTDAKKILGGGDTSVTDFFATKTREPLHGKFLPVVTQATEKVGLVEQYNKVASKAASMGLLKAQDANVQQYVTGKTLDGLYLMIGEEEKKIRQDPVGTGSAVLKKVFGVFK